MAEPARRLESLRSNGSMHDESMRTDSLDIYAADARSKPEHLARIGGDLLHTVLEYFSMPEKLTLRTLGKWFGNVIRDVYFGRLEDLKVRYEPLKEEDITNILRICTSLNSLQLVRAKEISLPAVELIVTRAPPHLTALRLCGCPNIDDECVRKVVQNLPSLNNLDISCCEKISDDAVRAIAEHKPGLTRLNLAICSRLTDEAVKAVTLGCPQLTDLDLRVLNITDSGLQAAFDSDKPLLQRLDLGLCTQLTTLGLRAAVEKSPNLTWLSLKGTRAGDDFVHALQKTKSLVDLSLYACESLTNKGVADVAKYLPQLTHLNLGLNSELGSTVSAVAMNCPSLQWLNLRICNGVTDSTLQLLANNCPGLTYLDVSGCKDVTAAGVRAIRENCKGIKKLYSFVE